MEELYLVKPSINQMSCKWVRYAFLFDETENVIDCIKEVGGNVFSIICDNNRVNQSFDCLAGKPWLTKDGMFLLFDFVHTSLLEVR